MRGSVAKKLRSVARDMTTGMPIVDYDQHKYQKKALISRWDDIGQLVKVPTAYTVYTQTLRPDCTRFVYQAMKKSYKTESRM